MTLDRKCGSAQQAVDFAAQGVIAGAYDVVVAGGVEMMSLVPMRVNRMGKDNEGPLFHQRYREGLVRQGISAELIAARWSISREEMDKLALELHRRAAAAEDRGVTLRSIVPLDATPSRFRSGTRGAPSIGGPSFRCAADKVILDRRVASDAFVAFGALLDPPGRGTDDHAFFLRREIALRAAGDCRRRILGGGRHFRRRR